MPFIRNRDFLLILFSLSLFFVCFSEVPESRDHETLSPESTAVAIEPEEFTKKIKEAYENNSISGSRIMMESGETSRYRYEYILRSGYDKVVSLSMPYSVTWYRYKGRGYIILDGKRILMEDKMKDLEDVFLEDLEEDIVEIKITEILYSGIPAFYTSVYGNDFTYRVIVLKQSMNFIRLEKQTSTKLTVMFYDNLNAGDKKAFENQMVWYKEIPLGTSFKSETAAVATEITEINSTNTAETISDAEKLIKKFEEIILPLKEAYVVEKTEIVEFSDANSVFLTLSSEELENPFVVSVVLYDINPGQMSENLFGKVPENYNHFQKIKDNLEVNVIGTHDVEFLKSIADMIIQE
jgi:hypothetical protein